MSGHYLRDNSKKRKLENEDEERDVVQKSRKYTRKKNVRQMKVWLSEDFCEPVQMIFPSDSTVYDMKVAIKDYGSIECVANVHVSKFAIFESTGLQKLSLADSMEVCLATHANTSRDPYLVRLIMEPVVSGVSANISSACASVKTEPSLQSGTCEQPFEVLDDAQEEQMVTKPRATNVLARDPPLLSLTQRLGTSKLLRDVAMTADKSVPAGVPVGMIPCQQCKIPLKMNTMNKYCSMCRSFSPHVSTVSSVYCCVVLHSTGN